MTISGQMAKQFREVHFGGNWTSVNLKETLADVNWQQAVSKVHSFNSIATLVYHINYYVSVVLKVLEGQTLNASDKLSFDMLPFKSEDDWNNLLNKTWAEAESFTQLVAQLPEERLSEIFVDEKYGTYYRNITGIIEHSHYHLGQIVIIKKLLSQS